MLIAITAPQVNQRGPQYMEKAFSSILDSIGDGDTFRLEYGQHDDSVGIFIGFADHLERQIVPHIESKYPNCSLMRIEESAVPADSSVGVWRTSLVLTPELFPILRHKQFQDLVAGAMEDPLESLLGVIASEGALRARIQITVRPVKRLRRWWARGAVKRLDRSFFRSHFRLASFYARFITRRWVWGFAFLVGLLATRDTHARSSESDATAGRFGDREEDVQAAADKIGGNLFEASICLLVSGPMDAERAVRMKLRTMKGAFGAFTKSRLATFRMTAIRRGRPRRQPTFIFSHEELATLFHPATQSVGTGRLATTPFTELQAPARIPSGKGSGETVIGQVKHKHDTRLVGIMQHDRRRHLYVIGKTGVGKTSLLQNLIMQDIQEGRGVCVVDPHGDLAERVASLIPSERTNDVIVFDPSDDEFSLSFNPLACPRPGYECDVASAIVTTFRKLYDSWGPRLEDTLRNAAYVTAENGGTLLTLMRLLTDELYRLKLVANTRNDVARDFFVREFASWNDRYRTEAVAAIQNKVRPFLLNEKIRAVVSQRGRSLDLRWVMDEGKILIVNLSKGLIGEDNSHLLGALLVTSIQQAAMSRADMEEEKRRDFYLYVDEFQNFMTGSFDTILSEARKYRLNLTVAHQYLGQLNDETAAAIFGNVGSTVCFQVGSADAPILAEQFSKFAGQVRSEDVTNLPEYTAYLRLAINGMASAPFSIETLEPQSVVTDRYAIVHRVSRQQFSRPLIKVQEELRKEFAIA